jgi:hypothetical protein
MNVRIGVAETSKVVEVEVESLDELKSELARAAEDGGLAWFTDTRGRDVGIPPDKVAFVEAESSEGGPAVGFAPAI